MFQSLSVEQLQTCLQMAIQQLINSNSTTGATSDDDAVTQQQHPQQQQQIEHLTAADIHQTVTNLSTEQMQQLMQLQQQQASLSVLNQPNVSCVIKYQWFCVPLLTLENHSTLSLYLICSVKELL